MKKIGLITLYGSITLGLFAGVIYACVVYPQIIMVAVGSCCLAMGHEVYKRLHE